MKKILLVLMLFVIGYVTTCLLINRKIDKWNWEKINTTNLTFPNDFIWGVASAAYQVEGGHDSTDSWGWWEKQTQPNGEPTVYEPAGISNNEWELFPKDIENMKFLGVDSYRFSISWSKIQPTADSYNEAALVHYDALIDSLLAHDITPMITFHHFTHPTWFEEKGALDKEENVYYFVDFVTKCFKRYGDRVHLFATFNEPAVYGYGRHIDQNHPNEFKEVSFQNLGIMLKNLLKAHDLAYKAIKSLPNGDKAKVGIVKSFMQMDPANSYDLGDQIIAHFANKLFLASMVNYFSEGTFNFQAFPVGANVTHTNGGEKCLDFIGLNYYSHNAFDLQYPAFDIDEAAKPLMYPNEIPTDLDYGYYPEGLYRAIRECSVIEKPIYITENGIGIGPEREDLRKQHLETALYDISKAIEEGYDVKAYYYWSLNDNYEWDFGYTKKFGLFSVDRTTLERSPKNTALFYKKSIEENKYNQSK